MMQLLTGVLWDLLIELTPAVAVAAVAHGVWRGAPHLQRLFETESTTKTARLLVWARSRTSSFAIFYYIALSLMFLAWVYFAAHRMVEHSAGSHDYLTYVSGIIASGAFLGFAFYLAEWRTVLRKRDAKDVAI